MSTEFIMAQVCGGIVALILFIAPHAKKRYLVITGDVLASIFCALQFFLLGAYTGMFVQILVGLRGLIFIFVEKRTGDRIKPHWLWLFAAAQVGVVWMTWAGWLSAIMLVSILYIYGQWQRRMAVMRSTLILAILANCVYSILTGAYVAGVLKFVQSISATVALIRGLIQAKNHKNNPDFIERRSGLVSPQYRLE